MSDTIHMMMIYSNESSPTFTHTHTHKHTHNDNPPCVGNSEREREREERGRNREKEREVRFDATLACPSPLLASPLSQARNAAAHRIQTLNTKPSTLNPVAGPQCGRRPVLGGQHPRRDAEEGSLQLQEVNKGGNRNDDESSRGRGAKADLVLGRGGAGQPGMIDHEDEGKALMGNSGAPCGLVLGVCQQGKGGGVSTLPVVRRRFTARRIVCAHTQLNARWDHCL